MSRIVVIVAIMFGLLSGPGVHAVRTASALPGLLAVAALDAVSDCGGEAVGGWAPEPPFCLASAQHMTGLERCQPAISPVEDGPVLAGPGTKRHLRRWCDQAASGIEIAPPHGPPRDGPIHRST